MKCIELGGACEIEFTANTFEEIAELSKKHGTEMFQKGDEAHLNAMKQMQQLMQNPNTMNKWFEDKRQTFNDLPDSE